MNMNFVVVRALFDLGRVDVDADVHFKKRGTRRTITTKENYLADGMIIIIIN
jgi:hypothetical protein